MKKLFLTLLVLSSSLLTPSAQSWLWARQGRNNAIHNVGQGIAMDNLHNAYLTGSYIDDTLILNSDTLFATMGKGRQAFLVKYDENGNLLWAKSSQTSKNGQAQAQNIITDGHNNVYTTGLFYDTVSFQSFSLENIHPNYSDIFLVKYDKNGNVLWARQSINDGIHGSINSGVALVTDNSGNVYVTGYFTDTINFGSQKLTCPYQAETFLVKYDSSGNVLWAKQSVGINRSSSGGNAIAIDKFGYIYVTGNFDDTMKFTLHTLKGSLNGDAFLVKFDSNGNVIWATQSHTLGQNQCSGFGICTDKENNIYIDGFFVDTVNFPTTTLIGAKQYNIFWAKYDSNGNELWAKQSYDLDSTIWGAFAIKTDNSENLYITANRNATGNKKLKIVFDMDTLSISSSTIYPSVFIKFDSSGAVLNGNVFQSGGGNTFQPMAVDSSGCYVYFGGETDTSIIFGNDTVGPYMYYNNKPVWPFIARWSDGKCVDEGVKNVEKQNFTVNLYPNPNDGTFTIHFSDISCQLSMEIFNILGEKIYHLNLTQKNTIINLLNSSSGIYLCRVTSLNGNLVSSCKFIIQ